MTTLGDEKVRWLDVSVDDPFGVCGIQSVGDFDGNKEHLLKFQGLTRNGVLYAGEIPVVGRVSKGRQEICRYRA
jgi:hypothetical protein